ncbi:MAG: bifunctional diaminohydroxyphosphoribosylaminopyrimidine deaminase/5-amino-6-(5-phosphoribosylamino)uracil reductase RibD [Sphingobacteriaceae bacterium]|nr:bifunctional diaminohydroxyphosphoribosylaminopyrimidine deaminase/5-amino-6-(5-phosphoribosylamino)uracil reductase RibD [Sphingobacteriaceae bacterium]
MKHALELAFKGLGHVAPNPMVGCVIVHNNQIIAEGYHEQYGSAHAEPNAIKQVSDELLKESTLYVTLEPCSHYGKTPPCADLIISKGIKKVVVGNLDTNPLVSGKGIQKLKDAGIEVEYGVLDNECRALNKRFFTFHEKKRPYVILKWAQTQDGFISHWPLPQDKEDNWITGKESKDLVHQWRSQEQAILIGYNTLMNDNPLLTTRLASGKNPIRLVLSRTIDLPEDLHIFNQDAKTIIFNPVKDEIKNNVEFVKIDWNKKAQEVLDYCFKHNISSVIVEGGTNTIYNFMNINAWDEAQVFVNPTKKFEHGISAPEINLNNITPINVGNDLLYTILNS